MQSSKWGNLIVQNVVVQGDRCFKPTRFAVVLEKDKPEKMSEGNWQSITSVKFQYYRDLTTIMHIWIINDKHSIYHSGIQIMNSDVLDKIIWFFSF